MLQGCLAVIGGGVVLLIIAAILIGGGDDDQQSVGPTAIPSRAPTTSAQQTAQTAESVAKNTEPSRNTPVSSVQQQARGQAASVTSAAYVPIQAEEGRTLRGVAYSAVRDPIDDALSTFVGIVDSEVDEFAFEQAALIVGCFEGQFAVLVSGMPFTLFENELDVEYRFDDETAFADKWLIVDDGGFDTAIAAPKPHEFAARLRRAETLVVRGTSNTDDTATVKFELDGLFDTPVQPNIDHCGEY